MPKVVNLKHNLQQYIGKTPKQADAIAKKVGMIIRATCIDGEPLMGTCDYRLDRINVVIENNIITAVSGIG